MYKISNKDDVKRYAGNIFRNGLPKGVSTGIPSLDPHYKYRFGEHRKDNYNVLPYA